MLTQTKQPDQRTDSLTWRIDRAEMLEQALDQWRSLERRLDNISVTCSATWTECWLRRYGDLVPYRIYTAEAAGQVRGMCLVTEGVGQKDGPFTIKTRHIGTAGEPQPGSVCVEYNRLLVEPAYEKDFTAQLAEHIRQDSRWERFQLDGIDCDTLEEWQKEFPTAQIRSRPSKYFDLKSTRENSQEILSQLGKSTRSNLRRLLKKYGQLECEWAEDADHAAEIFHELVELHQARWQSVGQAGAFASERFLRFQEDISLRLFLEQRAVLFRVRHEGETVGCLMLLVDRNRLLDYLSGFASFDSKPSPGLTTHYLCMEEALKRGYDAYDFLVGEKRHKDNLSTDVAQLHWLSWSRPSWKQLTITTLRHMKQRLRRGEQNSAAKIQQTEL